MIMEVWENKRWSGNIAERKELNTTFDKRVIQDFSQERELFMIFGNGAETHLEINYKSLN